MAWLRARTTPNGPTTVWDHPQENTTVRAPSRGLLVGAPAPSGPRSVVLVVVSGFTASERRAARPESRRRSPSVALAPPAAPGSRSGSIAPPLGGPATPSPATTSVLASRRKGESISAGGARAGDEPFGGGRELKRAPARATGAGSGGIESPAVVVPERLSAGRPTHGRLLVVLENELEGGTASGADGSQAAGRCRHFQRRPAQAAGRSFRRRGYLREIPRFRGHSSGGGCSSARLDRALQQREGMTASGAGSGEHSGRLARELHRGTAVRACVCHG